MKKFIKSQQCRESFKIFMIFWSIFFSDLWIKRVKETTTWKNQPFHNFDENIECHLLLIWPVTSGPVIVESSQFETVGAVLVRCYSRCVFSEFDIADSSKCYNNTELQWSLTQVIVSKICPSYCFLLKFSVLLLLMRSLLLSKYNNATDVSIFCMIAQF